MPAPPLQLKAPAEDGAMLAVPPLAEWPALVDRNRKLLARLPIPGPPRHAVVTGHQPELFHAGVWLKNAAAHHLARKVHGTALNLIVDSDLAKSAILRVPNGSTGQLELLPLDVSSSPRPFEERDVLDEGLFASLPERVAAIPPFRDCLLPHFWQGAMQARRRRLPLGACLAAGRQAVETEWGIGNQEATISSLTETPAFRQLFEQIGAELPHFVAVHNQAVASYRERRGLRGRHHPVALLSREGAAWEAPYWAWRAGDEKRQRLYIEPSAAGRTLLLVGERPTVLGPSLAAAAEAGWKIRPRALVTTLFARLYLADLFIHGLGGGLYDEMTDDIIRNFFAMEPPAYAILTGTLRLRPWPPPAEGAGNPAQRVALLRRQLRDLNYNPERFLNSAASSTTLSWVEEKRRRIAQLPITKAERFERFERIHVLNEQLRAKARDEHAELTARLAAAETEARRVHLFSDREYAFPLHEPDRLRAFLRQVHFD